MNDILPIPVGTSVQVRDGAERPPDRFKRKLREWEVHNFDGVVTEHLPASDDVPYPSYGVRWDKYGGAVKVTFLYVRPERVSAKL